MPERRNKTKDLEFIDLTGSPCGFLERRMEDKMKHNSMMDENL